MRYVLDSTDVQPGDQVLDIGCGWGRLLEWYADHGAYATGVTLSSDQAAYGRKLNKRHGDKVKIVLENFMTVDLPKKGYNVISSLEMAEHVGIRNYQPFLQKVYDLLADDGTLYFQVAGLRRGYGEYFALEELVWGLFMDEHVFPGAEASCPLGWVITQLERAGFEVQRAQNLGWHYSQTLAHWLDVWESKEASITRVHGVHDRGEQGGLREGAYRDAGSPCQAAQLRYDPHVSRHVSVFPGGWAKRSSSAIIDDQQFLYRPTKPAILISKLLYRLRRLHAAKSIQEMICAVPPEVVQSAARPNLSVFKNGE